MSYDFLELHPTHTVGRKLYQATDHRLGRHVNHDSRSLRYLVKAKDVSTLKSVRHQRYIPVLDQGDLGSCVGNAGTGNLGSALFWDEGSQVLSKTDADIDEQYAVNLYAETTTVDPYAGSYPPIDTGSDGLSCAKVLHGRELINGYTHANSLEAALTALAAQPVITGIEWREDMFSPDSDGRIHITGAVAGGHELVMDELDVENKRVWLTNSWTTDWGVDGRGYLTWDDFDELLSFEGDVTVFNPISRPAPEPLPVPTPEEELSELEKALRSARHAVRHIQNVMLAQPPEGV